VLLLRRYRTHLITEYSKYRRVKVGTAVTYALPSGQ
jgi:hypothetical protein